MHQTLPQQTSNKNLHPIPKTNTPIQQPHLVNHTTTNTAHQHQHRFSLPPRPQQITNNTPTSSHKSQQINTRPLPSSLPPLASSSSTVFSPSPSALPVSLGRRLLSGMGVHASYWPTSLLVDSPPPLGFLFQRPRRASTSPSGSLHHSFRSPWAGRCRISCSDSLACGCSRFFGLLFFALCVCVCVSAFHFACDDFSLL